jgi:hypothetical protein
MPTWVLSILNEIHDDVVEFGIRVLILGGYVFHMRPTHRDDPTLKRSGKGNVRAQDPDDAGRGS